MTVGGKFALALTPLVVLVALLTIFAFSLERDPNLVRSAFIDRPAPEFTLPAVAGGDRPGLATGDLRGQVGIVNFFASWCVPCHEEHPYLTALKQQTGAKLFGINQKDSAEAARGFLTKLGNPYDAIGADANGRASIDWGVTGVPETFVVDAQGIVTFKHIGPIDAQALPDLAAAVAAAKAGAGA